MPAAFRGVPPPPSFPPRRFPAPLHLLRGRAGRSAFLLPPGTAGRAGKCRKVILDVASFSDHSWREWQAARAAGDGEERDDQMGRGE